MLEGLLRVMAVLVLLQISLELLLFMQGAVAVAL
jgi:hypothetical protein